MAKREQKQTDAWQDIAAATADAGARPRLSEGIDVRGDTAIATKLVHERVRSLEDLIRVCQIDTRVWHVERWLCNKWDMGSMPRAVGSGNEWSRRHTKPMVTELFQVKAWLVDANVKKLTGRNNKAEFLKQFREILADDSFSFPSRPVQKITPVNKQDIEIAVVPSSDLHLSETVRPDDANGVNVYNTIIAANRLWEHAQKVKSIMARHMSLYTIQQIWVPLLGDVISGTVHEEFVPTNDLSDPAAVILGARLCAMFLQELRGLGIPVKVDCVHGNHARLTPKMPTKRQARTNMDWQIYEILADRFRTDDQIEINITTSQIGLRKLFDWNYLFEHGVGVRNGKEEDFEDRLRALFDDPVYRQATGYSGASFDQVVIGNLHKPKFLERTVVNGSYIGQNELGQSWRLKPIRAQQLMWGVSKRHPRTWQYQLDLTDIKSESADNPFSEYAAWFMGKHGQ